MKEHEYNLVLLIEECGEVIKAATKVLRYGANFKKDRTAQTNGRFLLTELRFLEAAVDEVMKTSDNSDLLTVQQQVYMKDRSRIGFEEQKDFSRRLGLLEPLPGRIPY